MTDIPPELVSLLDAWIDRLRAANVPIHGVYLYGSIALDAWNPSASDIDAVVVTNAQRTPATIHRGATRATAWRPDGIVPARTSA